ncbi:RING/FYVE/PHD zinc finger superfamily protein [Striga hermonthica]|uniref:RING/FYVE/PHD zinc finger superfamily protein n=1 Tax=Striga hermonthica TaxID=68872 RepID=A0A9N7NWJ0_STRHE|nr:RING/FYVE/PHD zinc finger superfamily protein [Striga hermonthica]
MSSSQQNEVADLESAKSINGGRDGGGVVEEIAGALESNCNNNNKDRDEKRESSVSECSVDLETGALQTKQRLANIRDCRICYLSLETTNQDCGGPIELGCSCKDDLGAAHKQCAEDWFKIKGNKICEICGSIAQNVGGVNVAESREQWDEANAIATSAAAASQSQNFWRGHRFLNFLLACMVFAFVISWLFHFNVPS